MLNKCYPREVGMGYMCTVTEHGTNKGKLSNKLNPEKVAPL